MNRKGFTLVELLATITILGIIVTIGGVSISGIIKNTKKKEYEQLVSSIKNAAEVYYQEKTYSEGGSGYYRLTLGDLLNGGYVSGNSEKDGKKTLINPKEKDTPEITDCYIRVEQIQVGNKTIISVYRDDTQSKCPAAY